jgi:hypothetical protein
MDLNQPIAMDTTRERNAPAAKGHTWYPTGVVDGADVALNACVCICTATLLGCCVKLPADPFPLLFVVALVLLAWLAALTALNRRKNQPTREVVRHAAGHTLPLAEQCSQSCRTPVAHLFAVNSVDCP